MKKLLSVNQTSTGINIAILMTRVAIALLMLVHGIPKMGMLFSGNTELFPAVMGLSSTLSLSLAVFAEVFCSVLLLAGFGTRLSVIPLAITMLVAVFLVHANDPFTNKELAVHYLFTYIVLFMTGSGKYSLDYLLQPNSARRNYLSARTEDPTFSIYR